MTPHRWLSLLVSFGVGAAGCTQRAPVPAASTASAEAASIGAPSASEVPVSKPPAPSASALSRRVSDAIATQGIGFRLSPVLPSAWPPQRAEVEWLAYRVEPLPTGVVSFAVKGLSSRVTLRLPDGAPELSVVSDGKPLGDDRRTVVSPPDEQALIDVVAGTRSAESARTELSSYARWAVDAGAIGEDVRRRNAAFFAWLDALDGQH